MKCPNCSHRFHYKQSIVVEHAGVPMSLRELASATGIPFSTIQNRYRAGDRGEALVRPINKKYSRGGAHNLDTDSREVCRETI